MQKKSSRAGQNRRPRKAAQLAVFCGLLALALLALFMLVKWQPGALLPQSSSAPPSEPGAVASSGAPSSVDSAPQPFVPEAVGPYDEEGIPLLVNKEHPLPEGYLPELASVGGDQQMAPRAAEAFLAMQSAAYGDGITLWVVSGYRSNATQRGLFEGRVAARMQEGYSREESEQMVGRFTAPPGCSEHEAGLAVDINSLEQTFDQTAEYAWLHENAVKFGFILRYQSDTEGITGYGYEPWHYRYVGTNHAAAIVEKGITLEEYVLLMQSEIGKNNCRKIE